MKITYSENQYGLFITLKPESVAELAQMARVAQNAKAVKPEITLYISGDDPECFIRLVKVKEKAQINQIRNKNRK